MIIMNRTEMYAKKRKGIAKTEYILIERLNDISERLEAISKRLDNMSEHLYYMAKTDRSELENAFDEMFKESLKEYDKFIGESND